MLSIVTVVILAVAVVVLVLFLALCVAIRNEDRRARLTTRPPTFGAALARRVMGLNVYRPASHRPRDCQRDPRLALSGTACSSDTGPDGR